MVYTIGFFGPSPHKSFGSWSITLARCWLHCPCLRFECWAWSGATQNRQRVPCKDDDLMKKYIYIRGNLLLSPLKFGNLALAFQIQSPSADCPCMFSTMFSDIYDICSVQDLSRAFRTAIFVSITPFGNRFLKGKCSIISGQHIPYLVL